MFRMHSSTAVVAALSVIAMGARANRDVIADAVTPIANSATLPVGKTIEAVRPSNHGSHEVARHSDGLFYVNVMINNRSVRFLVDTGASVAVLTARDARAAGIIVSGTYDRTVDTVGGSTPMKWTTLDTVDIAGHRLRGLRAAVVPDGLGVSLLGQNILSQLDSVTIAADRLSLR
jgi:aspartyl protease family protein